MRKTGVGIIGASPDRGWASDAHIPALAQSADLEFVALSTSRPQSAEAASRAYGVALAFDNHAALVGRPEVDVVSVAVKVPYHRELVEAAMSAGKAVYCEWPLGRNLAEAEEMAALVREAGVFAAVGLQARSQPVVRYLRHLVAQGFVGKVLSSSIVASAMNWGADVIAPYAYLLERKHGATMLTIPFGHTVDAFCWVLGEFADLSATLATQRPKVKLLETGEFIDSDVADHVAVAGQLVGGAVASIHFRGGMTRSENFVWEINGTEGDLRVTAPGGHIQMLPLSLSGARGAETEMTPIEVPAEFDEAPDVAEEWPSVSLARAYAGLVKDLRGGGARVLPSFDDAVIRHRMIEAIVKSAATGRRQSYAS